MIVTAAKDLIHEGRKVRAGDTINIVSTAARDMRTRGLVTFGGSGIGDPLAESAGESPSALPADQAAPQTTASESADGDSTKRKRKKRRAAE